MVVQNREKTPLDIAEDSVYDFMVNVMLYKDNIAEGNDEFAADDRKALIYMWPECKAAIETGIDYGLQHGEDYRAECLKSALDIDEQFMHGLQQE